MEGPFKGHPPHGQRVEFIGVCIFHVCQLQPAYLLPSLPLHSHSLLHFLRVQTEHALMNLYATL
jgi:hypothetical protein